MATSMATAKFDRFVFYDPTDDVPKGGWDAGPTRMRIELATGGITDEHLDYTGSGG